MKKIIRFEEATILNDQIEVFFEGKIKNEAQLSARFLTRNHADLVRLAYSLWGDDCIQHLEGTFAFVVIDPAAQRIFCARDPSGTYPLYYSFKPNVFFAFGTHINAVLGFIEVGKVIDNQTINDYLLAPQDHQPYLPDSFYEAIKRVEPGFGLSFSTSQVVKKTAWPLPQNSFGYLKTEADWTACFKERFEAAVRFQTADYQSVGSHLSGGLDSSSVSAVAQLINGATIKTVQVHTGQETIDERVFAEAVAQHSKTDHFTVQPSNLIWEQLTATTALLGYPHQLILPPAFHWAASEKFAQSGCDLILTGHDGDTIVGYGNAHVGTLLDNQGWTALGLAIKRLAQKRDLSNLVKNWPSLAEAEKIEAFKTAFWGNEIVKLVKQKAFWRVLNHLFNASVRFGVHPWQLWQWQTSKSRGARITTSLPQHFGVDMDNSTPENSFKITHYQEIYCGRMLEVAEQLTHFGRHFGHQYAHPFYDRQLVELCLAMPEALKFDEANGRGPLRRAMQGILPEKVRSRTHKSYFNAYSHSVSQQMATDALTIFSPNHPLWEFANRELFGRACANFAQNPPSLLHFNRVVQLGVWLDACQQQRT